jgi:hypothetical protein
MKILSGIKLYRLPSDEGALVLPPITFPTFGASAKSPYVIKEVDGLGPPEANPMISTTMNNTGVYKGLKPSLREITITLRINPFNILGKTPAELREEYIYEMLMPTYKQPLYVGLLDETGAEIRTASGYVKTITPNPFSEIPEIQLVISCLRPYFRGAQGTIAAEGAAAGTRIVTYPGNAPGGVNYTVNLTAAMSSFTFGLNHRQYFHLTFPFLIGDRIVISTEPGSQRAYVSRVGGSIDLSAAISSDDDWPLLDQQGANEINTLTSSYTFGSSSFNVNYWGY